MSSSKQPQPAGNVSEDGIFSSIWQAWRGACLPSPTSRCRTVLLQAASREDVNELLLQLPQAQNATDVFCLFADRVQRIFEGVQHIRCGRWSAFGSGKLQQGYAQRGC